MKEKNWFAIFSFGVVYIANVFGVMPLNLEISLLSLLRALAVL